MNTRTSIYIIKKNTRTYVPLCCKHQLQVCRGESWQQSIWLIGCIARLREAFSTYLPVADLAS